MTDARNTMMTRNAPKTIIPRIPPPPRPVTADVAAVLTELDRAHAFELRERERRIGVAYVHSAIQILWLIGAFSLLFFSPLVTDTLPADVRVWVSALSFFGILLVWLAGFYVFRWSLRRRFGRLLTRWTSVFPTAWYDYLVLLVALVALGVGPALLAENTALDHDDELVRDVGIAALPAMIAISFLLEAARARDRTHAWLGLGLLASLAAAVVVPTPAEAGALIMYGLLAGSLGLAGILRYRRVPSEAAR